MKREGEKREGEKREGKKREGKKREGKKRERIISAIVCFGSKKVNALF